MKSSYGSLILKLSYLVAILGFLLSSFSGLAFDRFYDIRDLDNYTYNFPHTLWGWLAAFLLKNGGTHSLFYFINSLILLTIQVLLLRRNAFSSPVLSLAYSVFIFFWISLGQLRYGTALLLALLFILPRNPFSNPLSLGLLNSFSSYFIHTLSGLLLPLLALIRTLIVSPVILSTSIFLTILLFLFTYSESMLPFVLDVVGYSNYVGSLDASGEYPGTYLKYLLFAFTLFPQRAFPRKSSIAFAFLLILFVILSFNPFAGRLFFVFILVISPLFIATASRLTIFQIGPIAMVLIYSVYQLLVSEDALIRFSTL